MSTDWSIVCDRCKASYHIGQRFAGGPSLGFGSGDAAGCRNVALFIDRHLEHTDSLRVMLDDLVPKDYIWGHVDRD